MGMITVRDVRPSPTVRVAVIGYGYWGPNLVRNFANIDGARVISVSDLDPQKLTLDPAVIQNISKLSSHRNAGMTSPNA